MPFFRIPSQTLAKQRQASDPNASVWVSANAGSGKTHVLAQRVVRLLLRRRRAVENSLPHLHQGGGGEYGDARVRQARHWTRLDDAKLRQSPSLRPARRAERARHGRGAQTLRAHRRDAGRIENSNDPRLLRKIAASVSLRGECAGALRGCRRGGAGGTARGGRGAKFSPRRRARFGVGGKLQRVDR